MNQFVRCALILILLMESRAFCIPPSCEDKLQLHLWPKIKETMDSFSLGIEERIAVAEARLRSVVAREGMVGIPAFAMRGFKYIEGTLPQGWDMERYPVFTSPQDIAQKGYLAENGANFFVFNPTDQEKHWASKQPQTAEEFFLRLFGTAGSILRYGAYVFREHDDSCRHRPMLIIVDLDRDFMIPISGGNDGITGYSFQLTVEFPSGERHGVPGLDVGQILRPADFKKYKDYYATLPPRAIVQPASPDPLSADAIPHSRIRRVLLEKDFPQEIIQDYFSMAEGPKGARFFPKDLRKPIALTRWVYMQALESLAERL